MIAVSLENRVCSGEAGSASFSTNNLGGKREARGKPVENPGWACDKRGSGGQDRREQEALSTRAGAEKKISSGQSARDDSYKSSKSILSGAHSSFFARLSSGRRKQRAVSKKDTESEL